MGNRNCTVSAKMPIDAEKMPIDAEKISKVLERLHKLPKSTLYGCIRIDDKMIQFLESSITPIELKHEVANAFDANFDSILELSKLVGYGTVPSRDNFADILKILTSFSTGEQIISADYSEYYGEIDSSNMTLTVKESKHDFNNRDDSSYRASVMYIIGNLIEIDGSIQNLKCQQQISTAGNIFSVFNGNTQYPSVEREYWRCDYDWGRDSSNNFSIKATINGNFVDIEIIYFDEVVCKIKASPIGLRYGVSNAIVSLKSDLSKDAVASRISQVLEFFNSAQRMSEQIKDATKKCRVKK